MLTHIKSGALMGARQGLVLTKEQEEICKVIYRKTENGYTLCGLYNPDIPDSNYADGLAAFPLTLSFGGYMPLASGTNVYNVTGSSDDEFNSSNDSWIDIWVNNITNYDRELDRTNPLPNNKKHNNHIRQSYVEALSGRTDNSWVGGHICTSRAKQNPGEGGSCLLLPIYRYLNSMRESVEMNVIPNGAIALQLVNFLK